MTNQNQSHTHSQARRGPLARFKVLDLTRLRSGPTAVRQLGDWGADVIKIETPEALGVSDGWGDARLGPDFQNLHRNKRSLTLNLKDPDGLANSQTRKLANNSFYLCPGAKFNFFKFCPFLC